MNKIKMEETKKEKEFIIISESLLQSWGKDIFSFASIGIMLWLNVIYFGNHVLIALVFAFCWFLMAAARGSKASKHFNTLESAKEYINNLK